VARLEEPRRADRCLHRVGAALLQRSRDHQRGDRVVAARGQRTHWRLASRAASTCEPVCRLAYSELLADERKETAAAFWSRANAYFAGAGITVRRVLTDNGACYRSRDFARVLSDHAITHKRTRPYRPQTNGKVERFNRIMLEEWAYARPYLTETERAAAFTNWLHTYNHHRGHTALQSASPADRVPNLAGQYI
jgi:transposase InsO family protein